MSRLTCDSDLPVFLARVAVDCHEPWPCSSQARAMTTRVQASSGGTGASSMTQATARWLTHCGALVTVCLPGGLMGCRECRIVCRGWLAGSPNLAGLTCEWIG